MSEIRTENSGNLTENSEGSFMSTVAEASTLLQQIAGPSGSVKERIRRAAAAAGITFGRAEDLWRLEARMVRAEEMDRLRREHATRQRQDRIERTEQHEISTLLDRIDLLEQRLAAFDEDVAREMVQAARGGRQ